MFRDNHINVHHHEWDSLQLQTPRLRLRLEWILLGSVYTFQLRLFDWSTRDGFFHGFSPHHLPELQALTAAMQLKGAAKAHIGLRRDVQFGKALLAVANSADGVKDGVCHGLANITKPMGWTGKKYNGDLHTQNYGTSPFEGVNHL